MNLIETDGLLVHSWCPSPDSISVEQISAIASLPFVTHCALMPDAHSGFSMPIGGVVACDGVVIPRAVGVDIGCGVCAVQTDIAADDLDEDKRMKILKFIQDMIPVGFRHNDQRRKTELRRHQSDKYEFIIEKTGVLEIPGKPVKDLEDAYFGQLGTLGGGNHYIEVDRDEDGQVWLTLHSGSRNIGKCVCEYYDGQAADMNQRWYSSVPEDIPFLPVADPLGKDYLTWMDFSLRFAFHNRQVIMVDVMDALTRICPTAVFGPILNIHHNYAAKERHFGKDVWVHRKGATLAAEGTRGIIPGSMGTKSYIVRGLGNYLSLNSCSHGAGRLMSRTAFNQEMNTEEGMAAIEEAMSGVTHLGFGKHRNRKGKETGLLDVSEAPQAYKDIDMVMAAQRDLVEIETELRPLAVLKDREDD